jgi:hypothetical protein
MLRELENTLALSSVGNPAKAFWRLGWIAFWTQIGFGSLPVILTIYALIFGQSSSTRAGNLLIEYLTIANLLLLAFTTVWSYWYTRLAQRLADPERQPSNFVLQRAAWIGVATGAAGIVFSMLVILFEVAQLLIYFLRAPQAGAPVIQTTGAGTATWVSAADMMSLMALILGMFGELTFLILSLWLLFRTTIAFVDSGDEE